MKRSIASVAALTSQIVTSATNFLLVLGLTRILSVRELGVASFWLAGLTLTVHALRQVCFDEFFQRSDRPGSILGIAAIVGSTASAIMVVAANLFVTGPRLTVVLLSLAVPLAAIQDALRYVAFSREKPITALIGDGVWLSLTAVLWFAVSTKTADRPAWIVLAWMIGAMISVGYLSLALRVGTHLAPDLAWLLRGEIARLRVVAVLASVVTGYGMLWLVGAISGLEAAGAARAILTVQGPFNIAFTALNLRAVKSVSQPRAAGAETRNLSFLSGLVGFSFAIGLLVLPAAWGLFVFGTTWPVVRITRAATALDIVISGMVLVPAVVCRVRHPRALARAAWTGALLQLLVAVVLLRHSTNYVYIGSSVAGNLALLASVSFAVKMNGMP